MKIKSVEKSLKKSKNVLEEKPKNFAKKLQKKTNTFTIIVMNFFQEQLKIKTIINNLGLAKIVVLKNVFNFLSIKNDCQSNCTD